MHEGLSHVTRADRSSCAGGSLCKATFGSYVRNYFKPIIQALWQCKRRIILPFDNAIVRNRRDIFPRGKILAVSDTVLVNLNHAAPLHYPREHHQQIDDEKNGGEEKITDVLADVEGEHHHEEEQERQHGDKNRALKIRGRDAVDGGEFAEVGLQVRHFRQSPG